MARHYKRKMQRQSWNEDNMKKALEAVTAGMGKKKIARQFDIPVMTLKEGPLLCIPSVTTMTKDWKMTENHPGSIITDYQVSSIFYEAYLMSCSPKNLIKGFQNTGIHQYNPDIFSEEDFAPAKTTDEKSENGDPVDAMRMERLTHTPQPEAHKLTPYSTVACPLDKNHRAHTKTVGPQPEKRMSYVKLGFPSNLPSTSTAATHFTFNSPSLDLQPETAPIELPMQKKMSPPPKSSLPVHNCIGGTEVTNQPRNIKTEKEEIITEKRKRMIEVTKTSLNSSEDGDCACLSCGELYKASMAGEGWSRCYVCNEFAHDACVGIEEDDDDNFQCDFCIPVARKRLHF
ncbi:hypothetical protein PR048_020154 [Dryococelus australis]|uniref:HTH psq-type domain-containing protein n=1 Tax=Dryococelus australis TaxID=614101 RepID=A0ABQ9H5Q6_9NEOP|nr:hypothetical protein PR048_020154 [Dryococelus australis]